MSRNLGQEIKKIREEKGLSQDGLAKLSGLTSNYIGRLERGDERVQNPTINTIKAIADALNIPLPIILFGKPLVGEETPKPPEDEIGPLQKDEKAFVLVLRKIKREEARKTLASVAKNFAKMDE